MKTFITDENTTLTLNDIAENIQQYNEEDITWDDFNILLSLDEGESHNIGINKIKRVS